MTNLLLTEALTPYAACGVPPKWALLVPTSDNVKVYEAQVFRPAPPDGYPYVEFPKKPLGWPLGPFYIVFARYSFLKDFK